MLGALRAAARGVDVDLEREGKGFERNGIGSAAWLVRCFRVQAALDLYLQSMRQMPSAQQQPQQCGFRYGTCPRYPELVVLEDNALPAPPRAQRPPVKGFVAPARELGIHQRRCKLLSLWRCS